VGTHTDFDIEYGRLLLDASTRDVGGIFAAWRTEYGAATLQDFWSWVSRVTGHDLFVLLDDAEITTFYEMLGEDRDTAMSILEGVGSGP
jgi:hypothetical protein